MSRTRTNIELDDEAVRRTMEMYGLRTKTEAVNYALKYVSGLPRLSTEEVRAMHGAHAIGEVPEDVGPY